VSENQENKFFIGQIILIDKPLGWTSFDVVKKLRYTIRKTLNIKKIKVGHAGTLDPLATGLLIICTGKFTKKINTLQAQEKEYTGIITLGATTASFDLEQPVDVEFATEHLTEKLIKTTALSFIGEQEQIAPIHSAKKINGKRAYEYARKGEEVKIKANIITIKEFDVELCENPSFEKIIDAKINHEKPYEKGVHLKFRIVCSKGTYIRAIARDFGEKLNTGGHLTQLTRTKIGDFSLKNAIKMEEIEKIFL